MVSRRRFLQLAGAAALGAWRHSLHTSAQAGDPEKPILTGRVVDYAGLFEQPAYTAAKIGAFADGDLIPIYEQVEAQGGYNRTWYRTDDGYVYSSNVVPMTPYLAPPPLVTHLGEWGAWAQVVAPWSDAHTEPDANAAFMYRLYYASLHHIVAVQRSGAGAWWYKIQDPRYSEVYWAEAAHLRVLAPQEFAPINPEVEDKYIEINLGTHVLAAYENGEKIFETRVTSGDTFYWEDGTTDYFETPDGGFKVMLKAPARHMGSRGTLGSFDYPGVPWCTFFTDTGLAIHGTYWHNDFGTQRSHGCINMRPEEALWVFRWTTPEMPYEAESLPTGHLRTTPIYIY
ncbi:MAG: L,D-transpeptidase [Anaerolineae bacterium]|nr:L,D-transpeptidase [Anaerolineae bacterium]